MKILIEDLEFQTIIGILPQERLTPQKVRIECTIDYTYSESLFINYAEVVSCIEHTMQEKQFHLVEQALESLSDVLKQKFSSIQKLSLTIRKPDILQNCTVGVQNNFIF